MATNPEVRSRFQRRNFTATEKAQILADYDAVRSPLERAKFARRTGVYRSLISSWRKQLRAPDASPPKRGWLANSEAVENRKLREENARLQRRLEKAILRPNRTASGFTRN